MTLKSVTSSRMNRLTQSWGIGCFGFLHSTLPVVGHKQGVMVKCGSDIHDFNILLACKIGFPFHLSGRGLLIAKMSILG